MSSTTSLPMGTTKALVVISHYDCRPLRNLQNLLRSLEEHVAGRSFDVCVVVNQESGRTVEVPTLSFSVKTLSRINAGMNIGAWDHGWRQNPGYDYYIFLQDECVILRNGWLQALVDPLTEPSIGIVGECINRRWCKTWEDLIGPEASQLEERVATLTSRRAQLCLQFMQARNIPAGHTARHLRSLIWGFSGQVLELLGGFPTGNNYEECIAAEIAVSRQVESLGLTVRQVHRSPFYYVGHTQWIRTYPGFSASLSYTDWARRQFSTSHFPFLTLKGISDAPERLDQLIKRVETERGLFDAAVIQPPLDFSALLVVFVDQAPIDRDLILTILSWSLQSAPCVDIVLVATDESLLEKLKTWKSRPEYIDFSEAHVCLQSEWSSSELDSYQFVFFARPGDQFHPSVASVVTFLNSAEKPDIVVWNEKKMARSDAGAWLLQQPKAGAFTLQMLGHIGMAFAVRPCWIKRFPYDFVDDLLNNNSHLFHLWLTRDTQVRWMTHPEVLSSRFLQESNKLDELPQFRQAYQTAYMQILGETGHFQTSPPPGGNGEYPLMPLQRARIASVIISFRDRPIETISCLTSLLGQKMNGRLEVILINNRSQDECLAAVKRAFEQLRQSDTLIKLIDCDEPFNHSRQTNLGVKNSVGDVLVFLNNDAELMGTNVLEGLTAWALLPEVGTVGCQIIGAEAQLLCAGIRARSSIPGIYDSPVEESRETSYRGHVQEVLANTFSCAAIARSKFDNVGWLNETEFPNGYNDVEYCLRLKQRNYRNVYLGHLQVKHIPGTSRGRCDESFQKILLRRRFPELLVEGMCQLSYEWRPEGRVGSSETEASKAPASQPASSNLSDGSPTPDIKLSASSQSIASREAPIGLKKALKVLYRAIIYWFQRRILRTA